MSTLSRVVSVLRSRPSLERHLVPSALAILDDVAEHPGAAMHEIAERVGTSKPGVSRWADTFAELGVVQRQEKPGDRRSVCLVLTEAGRAFHAALCAAASPPVS